MASTQKQLRISRTPLLFVCGFLFMTYSLVSLRILGLSYGAHVKRALLVWSQCVFKHWDGMTSHSWQEKCGYHQSYVRQLSPQTSREGGQKRSGHAGEGGPSMPVSLSSLETKSPDPHPSAPPPPPQPQRVSFPIICMISMAVAGQSFFMVAIFGFTTDNYNLWRSYLDPHYRRVSALMSRASDARSSMVRAIGLTKMDSVRASRSQSVMTVSL